MQMRTPGPARELPRREDRTFALVIGSLFAHFAGAWFAACIMGVLADGFGAIFEILFGAVLMLVFGLPPVLLAWLLCTLPFAALFLYSGLHQKFILTTFTGLFIGAAGAGFFGTEVFGFADLGWEHAR